VEAVTAIPTKTGLSSVFLRNSNLYAKICNQKVKVKKSKNIPLSGLGGL
jgi:hypothetical protein